MTETRYIVDGWCLYRAKERCSKQVRETGPYSLQTYISFMLGLEPPHEKLLISGHFCHGHQIILKLLNVSIAAI